MTKAGIAVIFAAGALVVAGAIARHAANQPTSPPPTAVGPHPAPPSSKAAPAGGLVAVIDPETHQVRAATPAEIAAAGGNAPDSSRLRLAAPPAVHLGPGSTVGVRLPGGSDVFAVVARGPDGKLKMECVTGEQDASRRLSAPPAPREQEK